MTKKLIPVFLLIFLLSASAIIFEISLSRLFSYMLNYHFVFIIISIALLGIAAGQIIYAKKYQKINSIALIFFFLLPFSILFSLITIFIIPQIPYLADAGNALFFYLILSIIPFISVGVINAYLFQQSSYSSRTIYAFDLFGASFGALLSYYLLNAINLISVFIFILLLSIILIAIRVIYFERKRNKKFIYLTLGLSFLLLSVILSDNVSINIPMAKSMNKDLYRIESNTNGKVENIASRWNSFGKSDLVKINYSDSTSEMSLFIDGEAGTKVVKIDELKKNLEEQRQVLKDRGEFFPFYFLTPEEKDDALIIGPGGGIDIAVNYFGNTKHIDAVEVNPSFVNLMMKYNKSTFKDLKNLTVYVQEGRNFVRNVKHRYNLIFLTLPVTKSGRSTDFFSLTENYLFTVNALKDYMNILTDNGRIIFTMHSREEIYRLISNYLQYRKDSGLDNTSAFDNLYVISNGMMPVLVIKKTPFTKKDIKLRHYTAHKLNLINDNAFFPYIKQIKIDTTLYNGQTVRWQMFDNVLYNISENRYSFHALSSSASIDLNPVTDNAPFFYHFKSGIPKELIYLFFFGLLILIGIFIYIKNKNVMEADGEMNQFKLQVLSKYFITLAFLLGFSYLLYQAYLFHILSLNLDNPAKSFSVLLFSFLLGNGLGSLFSTKINRNRLIMTGVSISLIIIVIIFEQYLLIPLVIHSSSELLLSGAIFIPAFLIGIPFPLLLKELSLFKEKNGIAIMLGISGVACFIASIVAIIAAMLYGYSIILYLSVTIYLIILLSIIIMIRRSKLIKYEKKLIYEQTEKDYAKQYIYEKNE